MKPTIRNLDRLGIEYKAEYKSEYIITPFNGRIEKRKSFLKFMDEIGLTKIKNKQRVVNLDSGRTQKGAMDEFNKILNEKPKITLMLENCKEIVKNIFIIGRCNLRVYLFYKNKNEIYERKIKEFGKDEIEKVRIGPKYYLIK